MSKKNSGMKSAYELAMERLSEPGDECRNLSDEQKEEIAQIDRKAKAKVAELEIMHRQNVEKAGMDRLALHALEVALHEQVQKANDQAETDKDAIREG